MRPWRAGMYSGWSAGWPAALEDLDLQGIAVGLQTHLHTQHGRRGLGPGPGGTHHEQQLGMFAGGHLQATELVGAGLRQPGQHGGDIGTPQRLLAGPHAGGGRVGGDPQQTFGGQALGREPGPERRMRRPHQQYRACRGPGQGRQQQAPFVLAAVGLQDFDQCAYRPAAPGQLRIQRCMPGGQHHTGRACQGIGTPDGAGIGHGDRQGGHEKKGIKILY